MASLSSQVPQGTATEFLNRIGRFGGTKEDIRKLNGDDVLMEAWVGDLRKRLAPSPPHTVITFEIAGRQYEAVSFLNAGEPSVNGDTMVARTEGENGGGLGEDEGLFLWKHRKEWPAELKRHYLVCTKWRDPDPRGVRFFGWSDDDWYQGWGSLVSQWHDAELVLRRRM